MAKLEDTISHFLGGDKSLFNGKVLTIIALIFIVLCTDIFDNFLDDDNIWVWIILIIFLLFNFDDSCY